MGRRRAVLVLLAFLAVGLAQPAFGQRREVYYAGGKQVSASTYRAALLVNNSIAEARKGNVAEAARLLRRALMLAPALPEAHCNLGLMLARLGDPDGASEQLRMAIVCDRSAPRPRLILAAIAESKGEIEDAIKIYNQFVEDCPDSTMASAVREKAGLLGKEAARRRKVRQTAGRAAWSVDDYFADAVEAGIRRWSDCRMPLRVYILPGADQLAGYEPDYEQVLKDSFGEWQEASAGKVKFVFLSPEQRRQADITCRWVEDTKDMNSDAENGETNLRFELGTIRKAKITLLLTDNSAFPFTRNMIRTLCLHEIGHSLGIWGHSSNPEDVMFSIMPIVEKEQHLSARDKNTLRLLYNHELDWLSSKWEEMQARTQENAVNLVVFAGFATLLVVAVLAAVWRVCTLTSKGKRKRKKSESRKGKPAS